MPTKSVNMEFVCMCIYLNEKENKYSQSQVAHDFNACLISNMSWKNGMVPIPKVVTKSQ